MHTFLRPLSAAALLLCASMNTALAENRSYDGSGNNTVVTSQGAAGTRLLRISYDPEYAGTNSAMITDAQRGNPRDISNSISAQIGSHPNNRGLSGFIWAWGQFVDHDLDLSSSSNGSATNGSAPIAINDSQDLLGPSAIPFTRSNYLILNNVRWPINEVSNYLDASQVYGSDSTRAAALRTNGGAGAKLATSTGDLLPFNTTGLANDNEGPLATDQLFLAGDVRSNENPLLTALHTIFVREHNRLVDKIAVQQPGLTAEQQYQLARKLVVAEMEAVTYHEFLPALLGTGASVPRAEQYSYDINQRATITDSFSTAAFRFGHSAVTSQLELATDSGAAAGSVALRDVFFNPTVLSSNPTMVEKMLAGAATQRSEEIDTQLVDDMRNFLFGPPGAGGMDLAALNIQRGRDHGTPNYNILRGAYGLNPIQNFSQITSDTTLAQKLQALYGNVNNIDAWTGCLAEDHVSGASVGPLVQAILDNQFTRLRDGDRLFYRNNADGLYSNGVENSSTASLVDLDHVRLSDIILADSSITDLQSNVFFVAPTTGDYNGDGVVDGGDYIIWRRLLGTNSPRADGDGSGTDDTADFNVWRANFGRTYAFPAAGASALNANVPEPSAAILMLAALFILGTSQTSSERRGSPTPY